MKNHLQNISGLKYNIVPVIYMMSKALARKRVIKGKTMEQ